MKVKRLLFFILATMLAMGVFAGGRTDNVSPVGGSAQAARGPSSDYPYTDYRYHSQFPLNRSTPMRIAVRRDPNYGADWDKTWFWNWMIAKSGLKFEIEQVLSTAITERKSLMFAANDLPEVLIGFTFSTSELVRYGQTEGQLLTLNKYITPDIMPNLTQWFNDYPDWKNSCIAPDGNIYSLPCFIKYNPGNSERFFWNRTWLNEVGKDIPRTFDDFLDVLYAFKRARPDSYPLGGGARGDDPRSYILNAMGYLTNANSDKGYEIALRDGQIVIPGGDPLYKEYLTIMKRLYDDQIINPSFFSMEGTAINAVLADDKNGTWPRYTYLVTPQAEKYRQWESGYPLTSQWNLKPQWLAVSRLVIGECVVTSAARDVETTMRWLDFFFSDMGGLYQWDGPAANSDDCMGMTKGFIIDDEGNFAFLDVQNGTYESDFDRNYQQMMGFYNAFGNRAHAIGHPELPMYEPVMQMFYGAPIKVIGTDPNKNGDQHFRYSMLQNITPFEIERFPYLIYFDEKTSITMSDLASVINPFIETETAKFITGIRNISEFDTYLRELRALDFDVHLNNYRKAWTN